MYIILVFFLVVFSHFAVKAKDTWGLFFFPLSPEICPSRVRMEAVLQEWPILMIWTGPEIDKASQHEECHLFIYLFFPSKVTFHVSFTLRVVQRRQTYVVFSFCGTLQQEIHSSHLLNCSKLSILNPCSLLNSVQAKIAESST